MLKIYLDSCCYNRPYDEQTNLKVSLQTQAKLQIQSQAIADKCLLIWSFILDYENSVNPFEHKRNAIQEWQYIAKENIIDNKVIREIAEKLKSTGIRTKDALHIACAVYAKADYFVTTDDKLLNKKIDIMNIISPIDYISREDN